jgi:hypothetical protein
VIFLIKTNFATADNLQIQNRCRAYDLLVVAVFGFWDSANLRIRTRIFQKKFRLSCLTGDFSVRFYRKVAENYF